MADLGGSDPMDKELRQRKAGDASHGRNRLVDAGIPGSAESGVSLQAEVEQSSNRPGSIRCTVRR